MTRLLTIAFLLITVGAQAQEAAERRAPTFIRATGRVVYQNPRGELVGVDGFTVYLREVANGADLCLNSTVAYGDTDPDGYFDISGTYSPGNFLCDGSPDVLISLASGSVKTTLVPDFPGGTIDFGVINMPNERANESMHSWNVWVRAYRWFEERGHPMADAYWTQGRPQVRYDDAEGWTTQHVVYWAGGLITASARLNVADRWNELVIARLFAEEWLLWNANHWDLDGCNGVCDEERFRLGSNFAEEFCGYCTWCPENATVAWQQGFASWAASEIVSEFELRYGDTPFHEVSYEHPQDCGVTAQTQWETPGLFAAVLTDISDSRNEHSALTPGYWDALSVGPDPIVDLFASTLQQHPVHFFNEFKAAHPSLCSELALTALHNGYLIDNTAPGAVTNLVSTSHTVGIPSSDATVDLNWTAPPDDCESAWQYSIRWGASAQLPDTTAEARGLTNWTSDEIPTGGWYFTIRSADAAGNWNSSYDTVGPIIITPPTPANLQNLTRAGWAARVTPRENGSASSGSVVAPVFLTGGSKSTWWNASVGNTGGASTAVGSGLWVQADGIGFYNPFDPVDHAASIPVLSGFASHAALNLGPILVRGGRHTFGAYNDFTGLVAESSETDNYWAQQWIWSPYQLGIAGSTSRFSPPARTGGWTGSTSVTWFNSDGINFPASGTGTGWWNAVTLVANARDADYDARLHVASTGPTDGFGANVGFSGRPADCVDAVIANRNQASNSNWDVGIVQGNDEAVLSAYEVRHVTSTLETFGVERTFSHTQYEYMSLHEVWIDAADLGPVSFVVRCITSDDAPFHVSWLDHSFSTGGLDDYTDTSVSDQTGEARLDMNVAASGYHCLVVHRDPKDGAIEAEDYIIDIDVTPPDLVPATPAGWAGPIVARAAGDAAPGSAPAPVSLPGWATSTWVNVALENAGPTDATTAFNVDVDLDGTLLAPLGTPSGLAALTGIEGQNVGPYDVRGGRHTLSMRIDDPDVIEEISELNNTTAKQYAWTPQSLSFGLNAAIPMPGDPFGSWEHLDWSDPAVIWPNADGYRTPAFDPSSGWGGVAVMPGAASDVTLRSHYAMDHVDLSFGTPIGFSGYSLGETDFILLDLPTLNAPEYDIGLSGGVGTEDSVIEVVTSTFLANDPAGNYGVFQLGASEMLDLHEVTLTSAALWVRLENLSASADLGISIHEAGVGALGRVDAIPDGAAWINVAGGDETILCALPAAGNYCVAVWKTGAASMAEVADYRLVFQALTDAPSSVPVSRTRLVGARPNPFNPQTEISFELDARSRVALSIYDVRGQLVRNLLDISYAAGRHSAVWNGIDDSGRGVASGVYLVRFAANGIEERKKITLVK